MFNDDEMKKYLLDTAKAVKFAKGAILNKEGVEEGKQAAKELSDDDLLLKIFDVFGQFVIECQGNNIMAIYGLAAAYFVLECEALERNLYY